MLSLVDQLNRPVQLSNTPLRIVSLVPSLSEYLCYIGMEKELIGITKFCVHPPFLRKEKSIIGGTKNPNLEKIKLLKPDLIIANKEENRKEDLEQLAKEFPIYISDINSINESYSALEDISILCNKKENGTACILKLKATIKAIKKLNETKDCIYLIWKNPYMAVGSNNYINDLLEKLGWKNLAVSLKGRYPEWKVQDGDFHILLSSEPYPFGNKDKEELAKLCPNAKIHLVNGEAFSWYGSRLINAAEDLTILKND